MSESDGRKVKLVLHPIEFDLAAGDKVVDITAETNKWPDVRGEIIEINGSNIKVRYTSGNERWKMHISLRKDNEE